MGTWISNWRQKALLRRQQRLIQCCSVYVVDQFGLALPCIGINVTFPEEPILKTLAASMHDSKALGASIVAALDYAANAERPSNTGSPTSKWVDFLDGMERYRKSIGVSKRRFESEMASVIITRKAGEVFVQKTTPAHGRFAFEGLPLAHNPSPIPAASTIEIGEMVQAIWMNRREDI